MDTFSIFISSKEYIVHPSEHGPAIHYIVKVGGKSVVFQPDENGELVTTKKDEPVLYLQIAEAIHAHYA